MAKYFPPKGYKRFDMPLLHSFSYDIALGMEASTKDSTIITLFRSSEACNDPTTIEVQPSNDNFLEETGGLCQPNSIIQNLKFKLTASLPKLAIETDKVRALKFNWMPIYMAFEDMYNAQDTKSATDVESILELQHETTNKSAFPLFNTTNISLENHPMSTVNKTEVFGDVGLTADTGMEAVDFDEEAMWATLRYKSNSGMLKKAMGQWHSIIILKDGKPYTHYNDGRVFPTVKRMNPYTYCGVLLTLPQAGTTNQFAEASETTAINHLYIKTQIQYEEWNHDFSQVEF